MRLQHKIITPGKAGDLDGQREERAKGVKSSDERGKDRREGSWEDRERNGLINLFM